MNFEGFKTDKLKVSDNVDIHYGVNFSIDNIPSRPTVVFNYGLVCNIAHFKYQISYFHDQGYNVIFHDYRFHFESSSTKEIADLSFNNICSDMNHLLHFLGVTEAFHIGHSMGVNVTLEFARRYPTKVLGMVLISGTVLPPQDILFNTNWMDFIQPLLEDLLEKYPDLYEKFWKSGQYNPILNYLVHKGGFNVEKVPIEFVTYYLKKIGELSPNVFFQLLKEMKNHDIISHLENIYTNTLVMGGDKDQVIPNFLQNIISDSMPNASSYVIRDGSHVPQVDFPNSVNERIQIFFEKILAKN